MPYLQYEVHLETNLNSHQIAILEKNEEDQFNSILSNAKNKIIDLLDLFFPPRFKKKVTRLELYPTLPSTVHRKRMLEFLQARIKSRQIKLGLDVDCISGLDNLATESITPAFKPGLYPYFKSYAVVDYDHTGKALVDDTTILGSLIDTVTFVELVFECDLLPFELLNFNVILELYLQWNKNQLDHLNDKMKDEEGWSLIDAVSYAAGFYAMKSEVSNSGYIDGFTLEIPLTEKPLRWRQEIRENMIESHCFQRPKGQIDNGKLPEKILHLQKHWNKIFQNAKEAMKFGDIKHTGGEKVSRSDTRVREDDFFRWAKSKGYSHPTLKKLPKAKQKRSNPLHQLISDHRQDLIIKNGVVPSNESIWSSIYKTYQGQNAPFIDEMTRWSDHNAKIVWTSEHGNPLKPRLMNKKSFQTHISKYFSNNS